VIASFAASGWANGHAISPVYTSIEVKHQSRQRGEDRRSARTSCYDNLDKAGVPLERVILRASTSISPLNTAAGKDGKAKAYGGRSLRRPSRLNKEGFTPFQGLLKKYPPTPPAAAIDPRTDLAVLPYTGAQPGSPRRPC